MATTKKKKKRVCSEETRRKISERAKERYATMPAEKKAVITKGLTKKGECNWSRKNSDEMVRQQKEAFLAAAERNVGLIRCSANEVGLNSSQIYRWFAEDPEFKAKYDEIYESRKDICENALYKAIKQGNVQAITFALKSKFGYREKIEIEGKVDGNLNVSILSVDPIDD